MSVQAVNEIIGQYQISSGFSSRQLEELASDSKVQLIQFSNPLKINEIDQLEKLVFSRRPDIALRIYGHYGHRCDLTFIERLPSLRKVSADCLMDATGIEVVTQLENLEMLGVGIFNLDNFSFLEKINPNVTKLLLHQTRSKKPNIESISRFEKIRFLYIEGQEKGIESIRNLTNLEEVVLRSISTKDVSYLTHLPKLWSVDIKLGGIENLDAIATLPQIKYLELWQIRGLSDLSFVAKLKTLQNLFLQSLKQLSALPNLSDCTSLRRLYLENLKGLKDLSSLKSVPNLEEFIFVMAQNQKPADMVPV
ncbi:MAG: hypothetical protein RIB86_10380, partial [Imperialibacter sp.]